MALDKTGTLTKGDFTVQRVLGGEEVLRLCANLEQGSTHPIAASITAAAGNRDFPFPTGEGREEITGHGIHGWWRKTVICGNEKMMARFGIAARETDDNNGTWVWVAVNGEMAGKIQIADTLKPDARQRFPS